eukprot:TRINITY_DN27372_c0_g1_i2.p7 TRINITY_DN27372_c0_g1~~TRINITY_DN27372_c0_g1_i2.p7  ORF type:complete len:153 (+),score=10.73 TRINITY_DN27372_c0_g1_i2:662-1120(+)
MGPINLYRHKRNKGVYCTMKKLIRSIFIAAICGALFGCAPTSMYYWGSYSSSLYAYKKNPGDKTMGEYKKCIDDIITKSAKWNMRVPPGVYCEYGYIVAKEGNALDAAKYFDLEKSTYPESAYFIDKLKAQLLTPTDTPATKKDQYLSLIHI